MNGVAPFLMLAFQGENRNHKTGLEDGVAFAGAFRYTASEEGGHRCFIFSERWWQHSPS